MVCSGCVLAECAGMNCPVIEQTKAQIEAATNNLKQTKGKLKHEI